MSGNHHLPGHRAAERGGVLGWWPGCTGCPWTGDWTPDRDSVHDQFMAHYRQVTGAPPPVSPEHCEECLGTGGPLCRRCRGSGRTECGVCMGDPGEGFMSCNACQGRGWDECWTCWGYGAERCGTCGKRGAGRREFVLPEPVPASASAPSGSPVLTCLAVLFLAGIVLAVVQVILK
ncbi:hypothetical protein [Streptomyces sp. NPDC086519]|uniref:hypothetical protein n=1 Tax=Streptomyces sp. NPDC086519 TaxID=3154863 RepID=UPI003435D8B5